MSGRGGGRYGGGRGGGGRYAAGGGRATNPLHTGGRGAYGRGRGRGGGPGGAGGGDDLQRSREEAEAAACALEERLGFELYTEGEPRLGFLMNMSQGSIADRETGQTRSCVNCFFMCQDGTTFKAQVKFAPYFLLAAKGDTEQEVESYLRRRFEGRVLGVEVIAKEDLGLKNHLAGLRRKYLKVSFPTTQELMDVRRELMPAIARNKAAAEAEDAFDVPMGDAADAHTHTRRIADFIDNIVDIREYDVPYHHRYAIDTEVRCGSWYMVRSVAGEVALSPREDLLLRAEMRVCAFDIECTKLPLQFPNAAHDQVFMISYLIDGQGYLITNREVVSEDIADFEYTPKPEFKGPFRVFNERDEKALLRRWFDHMRALRPGIYVTYNGDFFDWPFLAERAERAGMDLYEELSVRLDKTGGATEARSRAVLHLDAFAWVKRDSYLPQGSQGLKAVTRTKLGYDPVEVDPEEMVLFAREQPQRMATYSVSDAVCTYYLYMTYVHPFIFSLCKVIPMSPDEVLRKGSGTLCEALLMVEAFRGNIVCPNKQTSPGDRFFNNHLIESETYIGGHVECLESGIFRRDIPCRFKLKPQAVQELIDNIDADLQYAIRTEGKMDPADVADYAEVRAKIVGMLEGLRDSPNREECPLIYHLDVAAMYPNIILTNRLQPPAIVTEDVCAACDFNVPGKTCLRPMEWVWRGENYSATRSEYAHLRAQLEVESFPDPTAPGGGLKHFRELPEDERERLVKARLKKYCQRVYKRVLDKPTTERKTSGVCMRENPFYVDTVRRFRDRRYEYKGLNKQWKGKLEAAKKSGNPATIAAAAEMCVLYDSLQLAHKCILNSFYGYVMRKGARWYSMEMAGIVTNTGAAIIQRARQLVEQLGKPLELDTDGIWCALPFSFPENFKLHRADGSRAMVLAYPCVILNRAVAVHNTNDQYQTLVDPATRTYATSSEMSIEFEVDGPYRAMILPASKEADKLIKKRYAVFDLDGCLAELKGFEMKRRGELKLIKVFQTEVFGSFLEGDTLETCYAAVAGIANRWLDMLETQGVDLTDAELLEYISESTVMSKTVEEYGDRKSAAITTAARLAQFLGDSRLQDKGLKCEYIVSNKPAGAPTSERVIPTQIFACEPAVARAYLRRWTRDAVPGDASTPPDPRALVDWEYYKQRLGGAIQKIITIPAAMQRVANPVPRVKHPDWLARRLRERNDPSRQLSLRDMFARAPAAAAEHDAAEGEEEGGEEGDAAAADADMEDGGVRSGAGVRPRPRVQRFGRLAGAGAPAEAAPASQPAPPAPPAPETPPDKREDYGAWLAHTKRKWAAERTARKKARAEAQRAAGRAGVPPGGAGGADLGDAEDGPGTGVGAFFRRADAAAAAASHWQLIQLAPARGAPPGTFTAHVLVGGAMYAVPIRVPRTVYVSLAAPDAAADAGLAPGRQRVARLLPHGAPAGHLYSVVLPDAEEDTAAVRGAGALALAAAAAPGDVLGVYESQLPPVQHAVLALGCCAAVARGARRRPLGEGFALAELEMKTTAACSYLAEPPGAPGALRHVALYRSGPAGGERALAALLLPASRLCVLVLTSRRGGAREVTPAAAARAMRGVLAADPGLAEAAAVEALQGLTFEVTYVRTDAEANAQLSRALDAHLARHRGPTLAVAEAPGGADAATAALPALAALPCVAVPANAADGEHARIGWQLPAARVALRRVAAAGPWLRERAALAAYAHVPVGNFGPDAAVCVADAFFARALRDAGHVLWASPSGEPDCGGGAGGALAAAAALGAAADDPAAPDAADAADADAEDAASTACVPGAYRCVCVELRLHHLAVCAIVNAHLLPDLGFDPAPGGGGGGEDGDGAALGGAHAAVPAFRVLRGLVSNWLTDAAARGNVHADVLLTQLYRWLSAPGSTLRDPALLRLVRGAMRRLLRALLAELQRLGGRVIYADAGVVHLATGRQAPPAAAAFVEGLTSALRGKDLFSWIDLQPGRVWHALLFRDAFNYGGILADVAPAGGEEEEGGDEPAAPPSTAGLSIKGNWNMAQYLPAAIRTEFELVVAEFIHEPYKFSRERAAAAAAAAEAAAAAAARWEAEDDGEPPPEPPPPPESAEEAEAAEARCITSLLDGYLTNRLIRVTKEIAERLGDGQHGPDGSPLPAGDPAAFPVLPGSHLSPGALGTPALAFVRAVCEVLSLDVRAEAAVASLRKQLLRLLRVREFSPAAAFADPCASHVLRDVLCAYCNDVRDLDLCRDPALAARDWRCAVPSCRHPYDTDALQARLLAGVRAAGGAYTLQDLACGRPACRRVRASRLAARCACGGAFAARTRPDAAAARLRVLHAVARYHGFDVLEEATAWHLGLPYDDARYAEGADDDDDADGYGSASDDGSSGSDSGDGSGSEGEAAQQRRRAAALARYAGDTEEDEEDEGAADAGGEERAAESSSDDDA